jgi:hypothetical protein
MDAPLYLIEGGYYTRGREEKRKEFLATNGTKKTRIRDLEI